MCISPFEFTEEKCGGGGGEGGGGEGGGEGGGGEGGGEGGGGEGGGEGGGCGAHELTGPLMTSWQANLD